MILNIKAYLLNLIGAITGKTVRKWEVFLIGEMGVTHMTFLKGSFVPTETLFSKAEKVPGKYLDRGTVNDVYNKMKVSEEAMVAIYCKQIG